MPQDEVKTRILVVEDETLIRMVGAEILEDAGFDVLEAADADEALRILQAHDDVLLLFSDVDMPGCQPARKTDPLSASKVDPIFEQSGGYPGSP